MREPAEVVEQLRTQARAADELHERSRTLLINAVRAGASAGLSQREIANAVGRSQPEVLRLLRFRGTTELGRRLTHNRKSILDLAAARGIRNVRVFGSVAKGTDRDGSDVDLLVDVPADTSLFALARLESDLEVLLGAKVDVVPAGSLRTNLAQGVLSKAVPL